MTVRGVMGASIVVLACAGWARAETVGDLLWSGAPLFTVADVDALDAATGLSADQRRAVEDLMLAGMTESAREAQVRRVRFREVAMELWFEQSQADPDEQSMLQAKIMIHRAAARQHSITAERRTLEEVRSLLTPAQDRDGWAALERHRRRRVALEVVGSASRTADPLLELAVEAKLDAEELALLKPVRDDLRSALDRHAVECIAAVREAEAETRDAWRREAAGEDTGHFKRPREKTKAQTRVSRAGAAVTAEVTRAFARAAEVLPDGARRKLQRARAPGMIGLWELVQGPLTGESVTGGWKCRDSLTREQRRAIDDLARAAWEEHLDMGVAELKWHDEAMMAGKEWNTDETVGRWGDKSRAIMDKLRADALAVLTPEQRVRANAFVDSRAEVEAAFEQPAGERLR